MPRNFFFLVVVSLILSLILITCPIVTDGKLIPRPENCLNDGFFCFEVVLGPKYSYQIQPSNPQLVWFSIYAERGDEAASGFHSHSWNISLTPRIDEADLFLDWKAVGEKWPKMRIEVKKLLNSILVYNLYKWREGSWLSLKGNEIWHFFSHLDPQEHSFHFVTSEFLDKELGFESQPLTLRIRGNVTRVRGQQRNVTVDFSTSEGAYIFGDRSDLRPAVASTEGHPGHETHDHSTSPTITTITTTTERPVTEGEAAESKVDDDMSSQSIDSTTGHTLIVLGIALTAILFAGVVFAVYKHLH